MTKEEEELRENREFRKHIGIFDLGPRQGRSLPRYTNIDEHSRLVEEADGGIAIEHIPSIHPYNERD